MYCSNVPRCCSNVPPVRGRFEQSDMSVFFNNLYKMRYTLNISYYCNQKDNK